MHAWSPARVSSLYVFGGAIGILGNVVAGRTSDHYGRRVTGVAFMVIGTLLEFLFYLLGGGAIVGCWIGWLFCDQAATTLLNAYGAELFPTTHRSAAGSVLLVARYGGGAIGLWLEGMLYSFAAGHWSAIRRLLSACIVAAVIMLFSFPETAGRELESIAADPSPGSIDGRI
jgi:predicted MFS family arabinose efflux permease